MTIDKRSGRWLSMAVAVAVAVARDDLISERSDGLMIQSNEKKGE